MTIVVEAYYKNNGFYYKKRPLHFNMLYNMHYIY